jgi:hypothetical protein
MATLMVVGEAREIVPNSEGLINVFGGTQKKEAATGVVKKLVVRVEPRIRIKPSKTRGERHLKIKTTSPSTTCP